MGWDVGASGFKLVLSPELPEIIERYLADDINGFLGEHDLTIDDIGSWVSHPGGPKVLEAINDALGLEDDALELSWRSLSEIGNLSSASVLHILRDARAKPPESVHGAPDGDGARASARNSCCCAGTEPAMVWYVLLIAAVAVERIAELVVSQRNLAWSRARGGVEFGAGHYPAMVALHTALLVGCLWEACIPPFLPALGWPMLAVVLAAQGLRWWCITTLGHHGTPASSSSPMRRG